MAVVLAVYAGAPGTPPGFTFPARDGETVESTHAALCTAARATAPRPSAAPLAALPVASAPLVAAPAATPAPAVAAAVASASGRPLSSAAARAPPSPPRS